jgi:hypothetical protein
MPKIVPIVEGDGEVTAVPVLLRKLLGEMNRYDIQVVTPKNAHGRTNLQVAGGLEKFVRYAWKERDCGAIFILLDAANQCPRDIAQDFCTRVQRLGVLFPVVIVCADHMYETWLIASLETIAGKDLDSRPGLPTGLTPPEDVETVKSAKSWLNSYFPEGRAYKETEDQLAMTRLLDTALVHQRSRSFRRLRHAVEEAVEAIDQNFKNVTPSFPVEQQSASKAGHDRKKKQ